MDDDLDGLDFTALLRRDGRLVGAVCANRPADFRRLRPLVGQETGGPGPV